MSHYQLLKISFHERVLIDTYDQSTTNQILDELKKHYQTEKIYVEMTTNGLASFSTKKKDKIRLDKQLILHIIGNYGWEPFAVQPEQDSYFFRKMTHD